MIAAWACLLVGNGLAAASPVYGFNVQTGTVQGQILQFAGAVSLGISPTYHAEKTRRDADSHILPPSLFSQK